MSNELHQKSLIALRSDLWMTCFHCAGETCPNNQWSHYYFFLQEEWAFDVWVIVLNFSKHSDFFFFFGLDDSTSNFPSSFYWYSLNLDSYYLFECFHPHWHSKEYFHLPNWKKSFKKETHSGHAKCRKIHNVGKSNKCLPPYFLEEELCKDVCCVGRLMCLFKYFE